MWSFLAFALVGLFVGAAARLLYPGRQFKQIVVTMALGVAGALVGWMISWAYYPEVEEHFQAGNIMLAILGAVIAVALHAGVHYARSIGDSRKTS